MYMTDTERGLRTLAGAITPLDDLPMKIEGGGQVGSLTEAVIFLAQNVGRIADAIERLAQE